MEPSNDGNVITVIDSAKCARKGYKDRADRYNLALTDRKNFHTRLSPVELFYLPVLIMTVKSPPIISLQAFNRFLLQSPDGNWTKAGSGYIY